MAMNPVSWFRTKIRSEYLIVDRSSRHYRLVNYVYGPGFFYKDAYKLEIEKSMLETLEKSQDINYQQYIREQIVKGIYKPEIPKNVSLCTYFWATAAAIFFGSWIVWLHRHMPRSKHKYLTYKPASTWRRFGISLAIWGALGTYNILSGNWLMGLGDLAIFGGFAMAIWQKKYVIAAFGAASDWVSDRAPKMPEIKINRPGLGVLGLLFAMLKAQKDKNCPRLDFVDRHEYKAPDRDIQP